MHQTSSVFCLAGTCSLVTGGGRGLGLGIANCLAAAGSDLVLVARSQGQLERAAEQIRGHYPVRVATLSVDLGRIEDLPEVIDQALHLGGRLDLLVNNAGTQVRRPFLDVTPEDFDQVMRVNLKALYFLSQHAARVMKEAGGGRIVNLASLTSKIAVPNTSIYGASKGAVFSLTKSMALELAPHGINVNAVAPGYVHTELTDLVFQDEVRRRWIESRTPLGRMGRPDDIGHAVVYLASPAASWVTGEVIFVDGGWSSA